MSMWLYQLSQSVWPVNSYRLDIWEGERWSWEVKKIAGTEVPTPGDAICFYYAQAGNCPAPGFYAWAVVLQCVEDRDIRRIYFRPVAPSDQLKMRPWWDDDAKRIAKEIRGAVPRGTLWPVSAELEQAIGTGFSRWVAGIESETSTNAEQPEGDGT